VSEFVCVYHFYNKKETFTSYQWCSRDTEFARHRDCTLLKVVHRVQKIHFSPSIFSYQDGALVAPLYFTLQAILS